MWSFPDVEGLAPCGRGGHACVAVGTRIVVFGGADRVPTAFNDVWTLETAKGRFEWTRISASIAPGCTLLPRAAASLTAIGDCVYLFGGQEPSTGICYNDVKVLNLTTWEWSDVEVADGSPPPRHSHAAGMLADTCLLIYGGAGQQSPALADIWLFNTLSRTWDRPAVVGRLPPGREMHSGCMVGPTQMLVYGGRGSDGRVLCDAAVFNAATLQWTQMEPTPFSRCAHSCVLLPLNSDNQLSSSQASPCTAAGGSTSKCSVCLYGGFSGDSVEGDVLSIDPNSLEIELVRRGPRATDKTGSVPSVRFAHCAAVVPTPDSSAGQVMVVIGGVNTKEDLNDVAVWVPSAARCSESGMSVS